jgi:hypothetical protein
VGNEGEALVVLVEARVDPGDRHERADRAVAEALGEHI